MILQEGRYYWSRDFRIHGPLVRLIDPPDKKFPFYDSFLMKCWTDNGCVMPGLESSMDLIEEFVKPVTPSDATPKVDRVVLASKILPRLAPDLTPSMAARQALQYADAFLKEIDNADS